MVSEEEKEEVRVKVELDVEPHPDIPRHNLHGMYGVFARQAYDIFEHDRLWGLCLWINRV